MFFKGRSSPRHVKRWHWYVLGLILLIAVVAKAYYFWHWPKAIIKFDQKTITVLVADTPSHRYRGLGGRETLGNYAGMLFRFVERQQHAMVMREMRFPLDIIWLDRGKVIDLASDVPLEPGASESQLVVYRARLPSDMVLELPAGEAVRLGIKIGTAMSIDRVR